MCNLKSCLTILLLLISYSESQNLPNIEESKKKPEQNLPDQPEGNIIVKANDLTGRQNVLIPKSSNVNNSSLISTSLKPSTNEAQEKPDPLDVEVSKLESGAITRGILVFVGLAVLFLAYVAFQTCRRKKMDKSRVIVRKYGVRTTRGDIEMEPLPLSDEEDDETVFDLTTSRISNH